MFTFKMNLETITTLEYRFYNKQDLNMFNYNSEIYFRNFELLINLENLKLKLDNAWTQLANFSLGQFTKLREIKLT